MIGFPKPEPRQRVKRRKARQERTVKQSVRQQCGDRDGFCRMVKALWEDDLPRALWPHICSGPSEWAHLRGHRRSNTRGQAPEKRHTTKHTLMLCRAMHRLEEAGTLRITYLTRRGCDGPIRFTVNL